MNLRRYQQDAIAALYRWFETKNGNPLLVLPTGAGKSVIVAAFVQEVLAAYPEERILVLTHVRELIAQNHAALLRLWPDAPAGIYSAGLRRREHSARVLFGGIQSLYKKPEKVGWVDLVLVDEAHLVPKKGMGMYRVFLTALLRINPKLKVIGLTATPFRTDSGRLDDGADRLFEGIAYNADVVSLIKDGYLSPVTAKSTRAAIDTAGVSRRGGDFVPGELQKAAMADDLVPAACREIVARGGSRRSWLIFCCGVQHAKAVEDEIRALGISVGSVFGETPAEERDSIVRSFRAGELRALVNVGVLTTGFDAPMVDLIALLRPTESPGLYVQMVGRGLRRAEGKGDCLVLDFGGNVCRHGPIDDVNVRTPGQGTGSAPVKECPTCQALVAAGTLQCPDCGHEWPPREATHDTAPADVPVVSVAPPTFERWRVDKMRCYRHEKPGKPPSMRVDYESGFSRRVSEWVCFEHQGFPRAKAQQWWVSRGGKLPAPETVDIALLRHEMGEIRSPYLVVVDTRGQYPDLRAVRMDREPGDEDDAPAAVTAGADEDLPF